MEDIDVETDEWYRQVEEEVERELLENDRVYRECKYVSFVGITCLWLILEANNKI